MTILGAQPSTVSLHQLAYPLASPLHRVLSSGIVSPIVDMVTPIFRAPFNELSETHPSELTPLAHTLLERHSLLARTGNRDALTTLQQWLLAHIVHRLQFNLVDIILCEIDDVISDGMKMGRFFPYTHIISFIMAKAKGTRVGPGGLALPSGLVAWSIYEAMFLNYRPTRPRDKRRGQRALVAVQQRWTEHEQRRRSSNRQSTRQASRA